MSSSGVALNDGRVQNRIENYNQFWQKDLNKEDEQNNKTRLEQYTDVVNGTSTLAFRCCLRYLIWTL